MANPNLQLLVDASRLLRPILNELVFGQPSSYRSSNLTFERNRCALVGINEASIASIVDAKKTTFVNTLRNCAIQTMLYSTDSGFAACCGDFRSGQW